MNKLKENKQILEDAEMLIRMLNDEVNRLRNIVARYHLRHGQYIQTGRVMIDESIDFMLDGDVRNLQVSCVDCDKLGIKSNFQKIQELNNKLGL